MKRQATDRELLQCFSLTKDLYIEYIYIFKFYKLLRKIYAILKMGKWLNQTNHKIGYQNGQ